MQKEILQTVLIAFAISVIVCPLYIRMQRRRRLGQQIRIDGPSRHLKKAGTPTSGGVVFLISALCALLIAGKFNIRLWLALVLTLGSAFIGWLDDYMKMVHGSSLGLKARDKISGQALLTIFFTALLYLFGEYNSAVELPFSNITIEMGWFYPVFIFVIIISTVNAVNLTDGIDGLATGTAIIALLAFLYIALESALPSLVLFCGALIGASFGFLLYNLHPARIFMGDAGSLGLGGALAAVAILTKAEFLLVVIGGIYVIEAISVILQVLSFQLAGRRILLMAPLHHHFELKGWSEWRVVIAFWGVTFVFALIGLLEWRL
ncbi:MAG: phospho-N-acetylmuramoyl-pentapeptide-transferase [Firmicutes bacterium]|nr:phospho-N-acetylmuramoyl-pentapeptide-transferase [Bacillota bacterium]